MKPSGDVIDFLADEAMLWKYMNLDIEDSDGYLSCDAVEAVECFFFKFGFMSLSALKRMKGV